MTSRIERQARPRLDRAAPAEAPAKISRSNGSKKTDNDFSTGGDSGPIPVGTHFARSAQPDALWGANSQGSRSDDPKSIARLSGADRGVKLAELQGRRDEMQKRIDARVIELDKKWNRSTTGTKTEALREYAANSQMLDPHTRREIRELVNQADHQQRRIERLQQRRDGLPPSRYANAEMRARRAELNAELRAARNEQKESVKEATAVIDAEGLKVDRLAETEQIIDPSAPDKGDPTSLSGMVKQFFSLNWLVNWLSTLISQHSQDISEKKAKEREMVLVNDLENQSVQQRLNANREALKILQKGISGSA